jgi:Ca-activated chloride channel family protein
LNLDFANPWLLFLLPVPIALWVWRRWTKRAALRYPAIGLLDGIPRARLPRVGGEALRLAAVLCATLAVAGPRVPDLKTRLPTEGIAIVVCLDTSGSMEEPFIWEGTSTPISRREAAKRAFKLFVAGGDGPDGIHFDGRSTERGTDAIGLVTFSNWPHPVCPPTTNHSVLLNILNDVKPASARDTGTNVGDAIAQGLILLDRSPLKRKVLILLSDGEHNIDFAEKDRKPVFPRQGASLAANLGIPIYTIDTGGDPPLDNPDVAKQRIAGREINQAVAEMTGGKSFIANEGPQLLDVCHQIDTMERQPIVSSVYRRHHEFYPWLALAAVGLAALAFALDQTIWRRVP